MRSPILVTGSAPPVTRNANLKARGLCGSATEETRPPCPTCPSARPNNGGPGGQHGRPRHTHRLRDRAAAAASSQTPSLPPSPGRNEQSSQTTSDSQNTTPSQIKLLLPLLTKWRLLRERKRAGDSAANEDAAAPAAANEVPATACCWGRPERVRGGCCRGLKSCGRSMSGITAWFGNRARADVPQLGSLVA